jgi:hypothetical protein
MLARDLDSSGKLRWPVNPMATVDGRIIACTDFDAGDSAFEIWVEPDMRGLLRSQLQNLLRRELGNIHSDQRHKLRDYPEIVAVPR